MTLKKYYSYDRILGLIIMSLLRVMRMASLSRVKGGLILLRVGQPILSSDLPLFIDEVENAKDKRRNFYHLDEETCVLSRYGLLRNGTYELIEQDTMSIAYVSEIQLIYEQMSGTDLNKLRYRTPYILPTGHDL